MARRIGSRFPVWDGLTNDQSGYLADLDRVVPARDDLGAAPTNAELATAINTLFEDMRVAGLMKRS